jgi:probable phosphoglycerate mutase
MLKLYLVRHGWTAWHTERRVAGWLDVPLDERGWTEAAAAGRWLVAHCAERPAALIASPVLRARQTAEVIAAAFDPALAAELDPAIGETHLPQWQGRLVDDIEASEPTWPQFFKAPADYRYPGGETNREMQQRVVTGIQSIQQRYPAGVVILVAHADPIRCLIAHYMGMDTALFYRLRIETGSISRLGLPAPNTQDRFARPRLEFMNLLVGGR